MSFSPAPTAYPSATPPKPYPATAADPVNPMGQLYPEGLYVHVPFCARKCSYCDFCAKVPRATELEVYTVAVQRELRAQAAYLRQSDLSPRPLRSVYFGGGTPSLLLPRQLAAILETVQQCFTLAPGAELSLEANPQPNLSKRLPEYQQLGLNRLSLGLQTADETLLPRLGRSHSLALVEQILERAAQLNWGNISLDLIFALPGQTWAGFAAELAWLEQRRSYFHHLSYYSLQLEAGTPLAVAMAQDDSTLPTADCERAMYHLLLDSLPALALTAYEISNAARPGQEAWHNSLYWRSQPYLAVGPSASSYLEGVRRSNCANIPAYLSHWAQEQPAFSLAQVDEVVDFAGARKEYMLLGLRFLAGVKRSEFAQLFGADPLDLFAGEIQTLQKQGLLVCTGDKIYLSKLGLDYANRVFAAFV